MSGQAGARGYLLQALICVLDAFDEDNHWTTVTVEPNELSERVDIVWQYANHRKVVQVKSSSNEISYANAARWAAELEAAVEADSYELKLIGECVTKVRGAREIGKVKIPAPRPLDIEVVCQLAAFKLARYLTRQRPARTISPDVCLIFIDALGLRFGEMSTRGAPLSRHEFDNRLRKWIREVSAPRGVSAIEADDEIADVVTYCLRFSEYYSQKLSPLVHTRFKFNDAESSSQELLDFLSGGTHGQIIGRSGYGKSHLLGHMALRSIDHACVPVMAKAIDYGGSLEDLLDRYVRSFCACKCAALTDATHRSGRTFLLIVDGVNECPASLLEQLLLELQAYHLRWKMPVVVSSQSHVTMPPELKGQLIEACDLSDEERHQILQAYHYGQLPSHADELCNGLRSAYELSIAATCLEQIVHRPNRAGLFDAYVRKRAGKEIDTAVLRRILATIAQAMRLELRSNLAIVDVERIAETILEQNKLTLSQLEPMLDSGFLDRHNGLCTFRHELLQRYFEALDLFDSHRGIGSLASELMQPAHHVLIEFVLGMETDVQRSCDLLRAISSLSLSSEILIEGLLGHYGKYVGAALTQDADKLFRLASENLSNLSLNVGEEASGERRVRVFKFENVRVWDAFEKAFWKAIAARTSAGQFLEPTLQLLALTEAVVNERLKVAAGESAFKKSSVRSQLFSDVFVLGMQGDSLPSYWLTNGAERYRLNRDTFIPHLCLGKRFTSKETIANAELYFLLRLSHGRHAAVAEHVPAIVERGWNSRIYHLQLETLHFVQSWANQNYGDVSLSPETRSEVERLLQSLETSDLMLNSMLLEVLSSFDLLELGFTAEDVRSQLLALLSQPDNPNAQESAAAAVSNTFEDVYQNIYFEAIESLTAEQRSSLYAMAGLAVPSYSMSAPIILDELLKAPTEEALGTFKRFATEFDDASVCPQETFRCFVSAHQGSAILCDTPWKLSNLESDDRKALQCYGEILFWMEKQELSSTEMSERCAPLWNALHSTLRHAAVDPLKELANARTMYGSYRKEDPISRLFKLFKSEICQLLERCLNEVDRLTWLDKRMHPSIALRALTTFLLHTLGQLGSESTLPLLMPFRHDEYHGETAVEAIRQINSGVAFTSLKLIRRFP